MLLGALCKMMREISRFFKTIIQIILMKKLKKSYRNINIKNFFLDYLKKLVINLSILDKFVLLM